MLKKLKDAESSAIPMMLKELLKNRDLKVKLRMQAEKTRKVHQK